MLPGRKRVNKRRAPRGLAHLRCSPEKIDAWLPALDRRLDDLNLLRDFRELVGEQTVELVEAAPCATLHEPDEDAAHGLRVDAFIAVEHKDLTTKGGAERLDGLGLPCACRTVRIPAIPHEHGLRKRQVALVCEWRMH